MEAQQDRLTTAAITFALVTGLAFASPVAFSGAQQAAAPQAPQPDALTFTSDRMLVIVRVAEASAVDFEVAMGKVKEVLAASDKPERKRQGQGWKLLKAAPQDGIVNFFFLLEQVEKGVSYDPFKILQEGLPPEEVKTLFDKVGPGLRGISAAPLAPIVNMGGSAGS